MTARIENVNGQKRLVKYVRESTVLSVEQWQALANEAQRLGTVVVGGSRAGLTGWRALVREIADGNLRLEWRTKRPST